MKTLKSVEAAKKAAKESNPSSEGIKIFLLEVRVDLNDLGNFEAGDYLQNLGDYAQVNTIDEGIVVE